MWLWVPSLNLSLGTSINDINLSFPTSFYPVLLCNQIYALRIPQKIILFQGLIFPHVLEIDIIRGALLWDVVIVDLELHKNLTMWWDFNRHFKDSSIMPPNLPGSCLVYRFIKKDFFKMQSRSNFRFDHLLQVVIFDPTEVLWWH